MSLNYQTSILSSQKNIGLEGGFFVFFFFGLCLVCPIKPVQSNIQHVNVSKQSIILEILISKVRKDHIMGPKSKFVGTLKMFKTSSFGLCYI